MEFFFLVWIEFVPKLLDFFVSIDFSLYFHLVVVNLFKTGRRPYRSSLQKKQIQLNLGDARIGRLYETINAIKS